jgi:hypothetical protein
MQEVRGVLTRCRSATFARWSRAGLDPLHMAEAGCRVLYRPSTVRSTSA